MDYTIYTLSKDNKIFYVGQTMEPQRRMQRHKKRFGICEMNYLDSANNTKESEELESYWIGQLISWNFNLINKQHSVNYVGHRKGASHSEETKRRMSVNTNGGGFKGKKHSEKTKIMLSKISKEGAQKGWETRRRNQQCR